MRREDYEIEGEELNWMTVLRAVVAVAVIMSALILAVEIGTIEEMCNEQIESGN